MKISSLLLSTQRALLGEINKNTKAIAIDFSEGVLNIFVYFYQQPSDDEVGEYNDITGEILSDFPEEILDIKYNFEIWDHHSSLAGIKHLAYLRKN